MSFLEVAEWRENKEIVHGFGIRRPLEEGATRLDWKGREVARRGRQLPLISLRQVHGDEIVLLPEKKENAADLWEREGDALMTGFSEIAVGVFTADCLPVLLFEPERKIAAAVHAGWRGTAQGITRKAVEKMAEVFSGDPGKIQAALGPCIGPCCYEVDRPVEEAFRRGGQPWETFVAPRGAGKWALDLQEANTLLLLQGGVKGENIRRLACCTSCRSDLFFSYRREKGTRGRHLNFISLLSSAR
jgi:polyphenol oxidase